MLQLLVIGCDSEVGDVKVIPGEGPVAKVVLPSGSKIDYIRMEPSFILSARVHGRIISLLVPERDGPLDRYIATVQQANASDRARWIVDDSNDGFRAVHRDERIVVVGEGDWSVNGRSVVLDAVIVSGEE